MYVSLIGNMLFCPRNLGPEFLGSPPRHHAADWCQLPPGVAKRKLWTPFILIPTTFTKPNGLPCPHVPQHLRSAQGPCREEELCFRPRALSAEGVGFISCVSRTRPREAPEVGPTEARPPLAVRRDEAVDVTGNRLLRLPQLELC